MSRTNECGHPERKHLARGMCAGCYSSWRLKNQPGYRETQRRYRRSHREQFREYNRKYEKRRAAEGHKRVRPPTKESRERSRLYREQKKAEVFEHYGKNCACCGESAIPFLTIDHVNDDGNKHRAELRGKQIYTWLVKNNFPGGFQVLCYNCNCGRYRNGGICPHKAEV